MIYTDDEIFDASLEILFHKNKLSFVNASFETVKSTENTVVTFDKELANWQITQDSLVTCTDPYKSNLVELGRLNSGPFDYNRTLYQLKLSPTHTGCQKVLTGK